MIDEPWPRTVHVGERVRIFVRITPPLDGSRVVFAQVDAIGDGRSGWSVPVALPAGSVDVGNTAAIWVQPMVAGRFKWQAAVTTAEGCTDATSLTGSNARPFEVIDISPPAKFQETQRQP